MCRVGARKAGSGKLAIMGYARDAIISRIEALDSRLMDAAIIAIQTT
jgi:hypothetical protein